ncbi:ABC transporter permease [Pseudomonas plecoglossicida]|uniref:Transport permease protein n=2 Tax=Pseudomonas TaxID=286 RepID=A0A2A3M7I2_PSEDL|nr:MULTISPECIES: ABC transporter permease [Pseudomonas]MDD2109861.1 ABC transporter permease [Pseudomonas asiatica]MDM9587706.1 ABC transporter permease [Pseudomonas asiatica]PBJ95984.1 ABC transporter permease [Pseudomonas plecoglossicida]
MNIWTAHFKYFDLVKQLVRRDVGLRFKGAILGVLWPLITPLMTLGMYAMVFGYFLPSRWPGVDGITGFALVLFPGLIVFNFFAECVNRAPTLITTNPNFVKKVVFPIELLIWVPIGSAAFQLGLSFIAWGIIALIMNGGLHWTVVFFPLVLAPLVICLLGVVWFLSALGVFLRDIAQLTLVITQALMFLSPVLYPLDKLPTWALQLLMLNPLTFIVNQVREILIYGNMPDFQGLLIYAVAAFIVCVLGLRFFRVVRHGFADVL